MSKVFDAAKAGRLKELKQLKKEGASFSEKDKYGNTALLWAACSGHLNVVKWLLKDVAVAQITEENKAGNTALLLAASYGHTELVIWLLRDGGAQITERNKLGNTVLSIAVNYEQLAIVDHLIRCYSRSLDFKFNFSPNNRAICYYFNVIELFSKKEIDYTALISILDSASKQLNNNESSYIYFIYYWMEIHHQAKNPSETIVNKSYIDQLLPSHQAELISCMFHVGYMLNNASTGTDRPDTQNIRLDKKQQEAINNLLKQRERDTYLLSKKSISEQEELYNDFYLIPLYRSLIHALQVEGELNRALLAPYTYHSSATNKPIVDVNIAKWTAYHLCRADNTSEQQHVNVYVRTTGLSRRGYYDILECCLNNQDPQKKILLTTLGNLADNNGERLRWVKEYPFWLQQLSQTLSTKKTSTQTHTLKLIGLSHTIQLDNEVGQQIWDSNKHEPQPSKLPGNHPVYHLQAQGIYCKLYPGLPGVNDALQYLYRRLFSVVGGLPWSVTGLLEIDNQVIPVLLSEDVGERIEANDVRLQNLNAYDLSKLILFSLITNPEDGKSDNYTLQKNEDGQYSIYSVDNDQGLVEATVESNNWLGFKTKKLSLKSLLFCLDVMKEALDERAVTEFLELNPMETLKAWLQDLTKLETEYEALFKDCRDRFTQEKMPYRRSYLHMVLPIATVVNIAYKMQCLQELLRKNSTTSSISLLEVVEPIAAQYYLKVLGGPLSATARFDELVRDGAHYGWCERTKSYSITLTLSKELFESLVLDNLADVVTPTIALKVFKEMTQEWELLKEEQVQLFKGEITRFNQLPLKEQQNLLKMVKFNQMPFQKRELFLNALMERTDFKDLYINNPQASLSNRRLLSLLRNNASLERLSIKNATSLAAFDRSPPSLIKFIHEDSFLGLFIWNKEYTVTLLNITELALRSCAELTSLQLDAPKLQRLSLIDCPNLTVLNLPKSLLLTQATIQDCGKLPLADFYDRWPGFISRWHELPMRLRQRLADCITDFFVESPVHSELREKIYNVVTDYTNLLTRLCIPLLSMLNTKNGFSAAYVLAHVGYDDPKVISTLFDGIVNHITFDIPGHRENAAVRALSELKINDARVVQPLLQLFSSKFGMHCNSAIQIAENLQVNDKRIIEKLLSLLGEYCFGLNAAKALKKLNVEEELITLALLRALEYWSTRLSKSTFEDSFDEVGINILALFQIKNERILLALLKMSEDDNYQVRVFAANAWFVLQIEDTSISYNLLKDVHRKVRRTAAQSLIALGVKDNYVIRCLFHKGMFYSENIFRHLKRKLAIKDESIILRLLSCLESESDIQLNAIKALKMLHVDDKRVVLALLKIVKNTNSITVDNVHRALLALQDLKAKEECVIDVLVNTLQIQGDDRIHREIINTLMVLNIKDERVISALCQVIERNGRCYEDAMCALSFLYPKDEYVLGILYKALSNKRTFGVAAECLSRLHDEMAFSAVLKILEQTEDKIILHQGFKALFRASPKFDFRLIYNMTERIGHKLNYIGYAAKDILALHIKDERVVQVYLRGLYHSVPTSGAYPGCYDVEAVLKQQFSNLISIEAENIKSPSFVTGDDVNTPVTGDDANTSVTGDDANTSVTGDDANMFVTDDDAKKITISGIAVDEQQINALEQLLKKRQYVLCLKQKNSVIEINKLYVKMTEEGGLHYTIIDPSGELREGQISSEKVGVELTAPLTLDQLNSSALVELLSQSKHATPNIHDLNFSDIEFTEQGFASFLRLLNQKPISPLLPQLRSLMLQGCRLDAQKLTPLVPLLAQMPMLTKLNLDNNLLNNQDLINIFKKLHDKFSRSSLVELSIRSNLIVINSIYGLNQLKEKMPSLSSLKKLYIEGNMIAECKWINHLKYKKLFDNVHMIFTLFLRYEPTISINVFLMATFIQFHRANIGKIIEIELGDIGKRRRINVSLNAKQYEDYYSLCLGPDKQEQFGKNIFSDLQSGLSQNKMDLDSPLSLDSSERKKQLRAAFSFHPDTNLKGLLRRQALFFSQGVLTLPSLLFPEKYITKEIGRVYLFANTRFNDQHAHLGYEFLTGDGQRVLKIAHFLTRKSDKNVVVFKEFFNNDTRTFNEFRQHHHIAQFEVDAKKIKAMHLNIMEDAAKDNIEGIYQRLITGSSRNKDDPEEERRINCISWCLDKMSDHLGLTINPGLYITREIVQKLIKDPASILVQRETDETSAHII